MENIFSNLLSDKRLSNAKSASFSRNVQCQAWRVFNFGTYFTFMFLRNYCVGEINSYFIHLFFFLLGSLCNCILPDTLKTTTVPHDPNFQRCESERKRLRSAFTCLSSMSMPQREVSVSSLFLHSHYKGCLPPWEFKRSRNDSLKEGWENPATFPSVQRIPTNHLSAMLS